MFRISRPKEPGVYDLDLFEGETIEGVTFSNLEHDNINIHLSSGLVFTLFVTSEGQLSAAVLDLRRPENHKGH